MIRVERNLGFCICPKCGYTIQKTFELPCASQRCPECGSPLRDG